MLHQVLLAENEDPGSGGGAPVAERLLSVMEVVLMEANSEPLEHGKVSENESYHQSAKFWNLSIKPPH